MKSKSSISSVTIFSALKKENDFNITVTDIQFNIEHVLQEVEVGRDEETGSQPLIHNPIPYKMKKIPTNCDHHGH